MKRSQIWLTVAVVGLVIVGVAIVKFTIIGFYPEELVPFLLLLLLGAGVAFVGDRLYRRAKIQE